MSDRGFATVDVLKFFRLQKGSIVCRRAFHALPFFVIIFSFNNFSAAQSGAGDVQRGERPPILVAKIPPEAMEPGIIRIKFRPELADFLEQAARPKDNQGNVQFGIKALDDLNQSYGVKEVRQTFYIVLQMKEYDERHRSWGFHLWYDLIVPAVTDPRAMVAAYAAQKEVSIAEPVYKKRLHSFTPNDPSFGAQWNYNNTGQTGGTPGSDIRMIDAWTLCKGNSSVIVAVIDGGIDYTHTDLAGNMWSSTGWNFVNNNSTITPHYHGTHVAGTIAANTNNSTGVSGIAGGSGSGDGVRLMSCQTFLPSGANGGFENAPVWAANHGAAISQNSWGYTNVGVYDTPVLDAIDYFNSHGGGGVMSGGISFFSAGNSGTTGQWYPACYSGSFGVAATGDKDIKSYYSNYDTWVKISAPGGDMSYGSTRGILSTQLSNSYGYLQGTSMACPHVSGVAALILSLRPGAFTAQQVKNLLSSSADNIDALNPSYAGKLGSGRVNAYQALQFALTSPVPTFSQWTLAFLGFLLLFCGVMLFFRMQKLKTKSLHEFL